MDPAEPNTTPPTEQKPEENPQSSQLYKKLLGNKKIVLLGGIFLLLLLFIPVILLTLPKGHTTTNTQTKMTHITPTQKSTSVKKTTTSKKSAPKLNKTLLYGTWTSQSSIIKAVDIDSSHTTTVVTLPFTIKKISVLSNHTLLYIDQVDTNGYGQRISVYDTQQEQIVTNIPADSGFSIVNYALSPNKRYLALWEIQLSQDTNTVQGGDSRIDVVDLTQPTLVNQLFDDSPISSTVPIHYPIAVLDNGTVFADNMMTDGQTLSITNNFAYGLSVIDFDGTNEQDISSMTNGTYGTVPTLSSDGKYLLFAGYNGTDGTTVKNGSRQAIATPDTVELLDTHTLKRYPLPNLPANNIYSNTQWDSQTGNPIITVLSPSQQQAGVFTYDLNKLTPTQLSTPTVNGTSFGYISQLNNTTTIVGIQSTDSSGIGDLGPTSTYGYTQIATTNATGKLTYLSLQDPLAQYIAILPGNYFK